MKLSQTDILQTSMPAIISKQIKILPGQTVKIPFEREMAVLTDDAIHFSSLQNS